MRRRKRIACLPGFNAERQGEQEAALPEGAPPGQGVSRSDWAIVPLLSSGVKRARAGPGAYEWAAISLDLFSTCTPQVELGY